MDRTETLPTETLPTDPEDAPLIVRVVDGASRGASVTIEDETLIGASESCALRVDDPAVSRRHASLRPSPLGVLLRDEASRNGTWLGEARVREVELAAGARFRIGTTHLEVTRSEEARASSRAEPVVHDRFGRFVGRAGSLQRLYRQLRRVAPTDAAVLLEGESGTGKELLAEALHEESARTEGPFVVVDCGSIPEALMESHLFGHVKGAFTGAERSVAGAFETASGGTLFLDEIGELPIALQTRLLRALEQRRVRRVGAQEWIDVDVRVIAATHRNLEREVEHERFRLDLYHRVAVVRLRVPPLRERLEDVPLLVAHLAARLGVDGRALAREIEARFAGAAWTGNVRELRNTVERLALLGEDADDGPASAPKASSLEAIAGSDQPYRAARAELLRAFHQRYVEDMLARCDGNVTRAAERAGVARRHFHRLKRGDEPE